MPAKVELDKQVIDKIIHSYAIENKNISLISRELVVSKKVIRRFLVSNGYEITRTGKFYRNLSDSTKDKIRKNLTGRPGTRKGKKMSTDQLYNNMRAQLKIDVDLSQYSDFNKLKYVTRWLSSRLGSAKNLGSTYIISFINKFYNDSTFNHLYDNWINDKNNKWIQPTLDHLIPTSRGGSSDLDNLQVLTWFENRAKADMTQDEWIEFKLKYKISGSIL